MFYLYIFLSICIGLFILIFRFIKSYNSTVRMKRHKLKDYADPNGNEREDIRLLFQQSLDNMSFLKNLQWTIMYYTLLIYGALFGLSFIPIFGTNLFILRFIFIAILTFFVTLALLVAPCVRIVVA